MDNNKVYGSQAFFPGVELFAIGGGQAYTLQWSIDGCGNWADVQEVEANTPIVVGDSPVGIWYRCNGTSANNYHVLRGM